MIVALPPRPRRRTLEPPAAVDVVTLQPLDRGAAIYADLLGHCAKSDGHPDVFLFRELVSRGRGPELPRISRKPVVRPAEERALQHPALEKSGRSRIEIVTREASWSARSTRMRRYTLQLENPRAVPALHPRPGETRGAKRLAADGPDPHRREPAAAQIWIVHAGVAVDLQDRYDERYAKLSTGTVLTSKLMQHVIDVDKVTIVDYLSGDDDTRRCGCLTAGSSGHRRVQSAQSSRGGGRSSDTSAGDSASSW